MSSRGGVLSPPRGPGPGFPERVETSDRGLRRAAVAAVAITYLLIVAGGLVRATGSGEGCTGWPKCSAGRWLPPLEYHSIIEYSHRMLAFLDIVVVATLVLVAWRGYRLVHRVFRPANAAIVLILLQAILGGIVVKGALAPALVTAHFATAMVLVAVLVDLLVAALTVDASPPGPIDRLTQLAAAVVAGTFALLLVGAYVRGENAGLVFGTWPLMDGRLVPDLSSAPAALQLAHRLLAALVGAGVIALALSAWGARAIRPAVATLTIVAGGLYATQVLIGAALVWTRRAPWAIVAHVTVSSLVWGALVAAATVARIGRRTALEGTGERS